MLRWNCKFIRQDPSQAPAIPENTYSNVKNQTSTDVESPPTCADSSAKQSQAMTQCHERSHLRVSAGEDVETQQPHQTVTRSGRSIVRPSRFKDFVT